MDTLLQGLPAMLLLGLLAGPAVRPEAAAAQQTPPSGAPAAPATPMTPSEPHERLLFFAGTWTVAELPAEARFRETCDWLSAGRRHMVCRSRWQAENGPREGLSIFSYRASDSAYVYHGFRAGGAVQPLLGRVSEDGQAWTFEGEEGQGATRRRTRVRIARLEDDTFRLVEQTAAGDAEWSAEDAVTYLPAPPEEP